MGWAAELSEDPETEPLDCWSCTLSLKDEVRPGLKNSVLLERSPVVFFVLEFVSLLTL